MVKVPSINSINSINSRQRGAGAFSVMARAIPAFLRSPIEEKLAATAEGVIGEIMASVPPSFTSFPIGRQTTESASKNLEDYGNGESLQESNKRNSVRNMTGLGKRKRKYP